MTESRECRRGHPVVGDNAIMTKGLTSARCRACKRATDRVWRDPSLEDRIQEISDEAYSDIVNHGTGRRPKPRPEPRPKPSKRKPTPKATEEKETFPSLNMTDRRMPFGVRRWLLRAQEERLQVADLPESMLPWLTSYGLIRPGKRAEDLVFSDRGRKIMRQLQSRFGG